MSAPAQRLVLDRATLVLPDRLAVGHVTVAGGKIERVGQGPFTGVGGCVYELPGLFVAPGLIDLQVNGGGGHDLGQGDPASVHGVAQWCVRNGTTGFLPTAITAPLPRVRRALAAVGQADHPAVLGLHMEGPFIAVAQAGAHDPAHVLPASAARLAQIVAGHEHMVRMVTLAPELPGAEELISAVRNMDAVASLGHSDATYDEANESLNRGVKAFTHLFNAMRGFHHREPGAAGAALDSDAYVGLVCDGVHVHPATVRLVARTKGFDRICLVSDAMAAAGLADGSYTLGGYPVSVRAGAARLADGTLAGSTLTMREAMRNFIRYTGCSLVEAVRCATLNPAQLLGLQERKGTLEEGKDADLFVFDEQFHVHSTIVGGHMAFSRFEGTALPEARTDTRIAEEGQG